MLKRFETRVQEIKDTSCAKLAEDVLDGIGLRITAERNIEAEHADMMIVVKGYGRDKMKLLKKGKLKP
jgi:hypothetical protein